MQKHDKMVALAKEKSAEMTETAITAIETMYRKNIKILLNDGENNGKEKFL